MERFTATPQQTRNVFTIWVSPELATIWLRNDTHNRRTGERPIAAYLRDMDAGAWRETGETVVWTGEFNPEYPYIQEDAILLNGGHRLKSAAQSQLGFPVYVVFDVDISGQDKTDRGRKRSYADQLFLHGEGSSSTLSAVARRYYGWQTGRRLFTSNLSAPVSTDTDLDNIISGNPGLREAAHFATLTKVDGLSTSLIALAYFLFRRIDAEDTEEFFRRLSKGVDLQEDSPVWHLRERLKQFGTSQVKPREGFLFAHVVKAWNQFRDGEHVQNLRVRTGGAAPEKFPEPR